MSYVPINPPFRAEPLRMVPEGKVAVLGLVSTKVAELESQEWLIERIEDAAKYLPMEQLAVSPQCGFASAHQGNKLSVDQQVGKLRRVVEVAQMLWS